MTKDHYQKYYDAAVANKDKNMMLIRWWDKYKNHTIEKRYLIRDNKITYGPGASPQMLNEYDSTLRQMTTIKMLKNGKILETTDMSKGNVDRLGEIFDLMSREQKDTRIKATRITFSPTLKMQ